MATDYTESSEVFVKKDKYSNLCLENYVKVMEKIYTKKDMIPILLIEMMDRDNRIRMTLDELSEKLSYPKTSLSSYFGKLKKMDFIKRVRNGEYMINPSISYKGSRMDRESLLTEYIAVGVKKGDKKDHKKDNEKR
ncbi:MAG: replication/maintenance protein RepL [Clostridioides sp.]|nr:replication/maintenance protein RepL [Clostridioides sp.]